MPSLIIDCGQQLVTHDLKQLPEHARAQPVKGNTILTLVRLFVSTKDLKKRCIDVIGFPASSTNKLVHGENPFSLRVVIST